MSLNADHATVPFALRRDEGEARWFLNALILIKSTGTATGGRPRPCWGPGTRYRLDPAGRG